MSDGKRNINVDLSYCEVVGKPRVWAGDLNSKIVIHDAHDTNRKQQVKVTLDLNPIQMEELIAALACAKSNLIEGFRRDVMKLGDEFQDTSHDQ